MIGSANTLITTNRGDGDMLLLGRKLYGPDSGLLVLPGGKSDEAILPETIEPAVLYAIERPIDTAIRETREETGLQLPWPPATYFLGGLMLSRYKEQAKSVSSYDYNIFLFRSHIDPQQADRACDSNELALEWHATSQLPYSEMQSDTPIWVPYALTLKEGDVLQAFVTCVNDTVVRRNVFVSRQGHLSVQVESSEMSS